MNHIYNTNNVFSVKDKSQKLSVVEEKQKGNSLFCPTEGTYLFLHCFVSRKVQAMYLNIQQTHVHSFKDSCSTEAALCRRSKYLGGLVPWSNAPQKCSQNVTAPFPMAARFHSTCLLNLLSRSDKNYFLLFNVHTLHHQFLHQIPAERLQGQI